MDIWEWVGETREALIENGHSRLAEVMHEVAHATCDGRHEHAEQLTIEGLSLVKDLRLPWVELFLRHWRLQSRVLHRLDASGGTMQEAISLLDFASREETRQCPQSVCVVQDFANCYAVLDGPGYVEERLSAAEETLARIDPSWSCFDCISGEKATALLDGRRFEEAVTFCKAQLGKLGDKTRYALSMNLTHAHLALGQNEEALQVVRRTNVAENGQTGAMHVRLLTCLCLARCGQTEEARPLLCPAEKVEPEDYLTWLRAVRELGPGNPGSNDWRLESAIEAMDRVLTDHDSRHTLFKIRIIAGQLAVQRGAKDSARRHLSLARSAVERLRKRDRPMLSCDALEVEIEAMPAAGIEVAGDTFEEWVESLPKDEERALEQLRLLADRFGGSVLLSLRQTSALRRLGRETDALRLLREARRRQPRDGQVALELGSALLEAGAHDEIDTLTGSASRAVRFEWGFTRSRSLVAREQADEAIRELTALAVQPGAPLSIHTLLVDVLRDQGKLEKALAHLDVVIRSSEASESFQWDRLVVATRLGRWDLVRQIATALGMELEPGEGPVEESWELCQVRLSAEDGRRELYVARRTGPVTARVVAVAPPWETQHYRDVVVFDPAPLNLDELEARRPDQDDPTLAQFVAVETVREGGYRSYMVDGVYPGEAAWTGLREELAKHEVALFIRMGPEEYTLVEGDSEEELGAVYATAAAPEAIDDSTLHRLLESLTRDYRHPLVWQELARAAGDDAAVAAHLKTIDRYGIE